MACYRHKKDIRNTRKLTEEERVKIHTFTYQNDCSYILYCSFRRVIGKKIAEEPRKAYLIGAIKAEHNHLPNPNPFHHLKTVSRRLNWDKTIHLTELARAVRQSFSSAARILD